MSNSGHGKQDQRTNSTMEDSTMTIDFLRARLLAERSVSKSARQRAEDLAKRVAELEEQLKVVSLQRKKAEKATADVLSILENNGTGDISEAFDSSSEQDTPCESKTGNTSPKNENPVDSKVRKNESDELSGFDPDFSPLPGRSLSWKGRKDPSRSNGKYKDSLSDRRSSFSYTGSSSSKQCRGSSCRRNRRNETRSVSVDSQNDSSKGDSQENGLSTASESCPTPSDGGQEISERVAESQNEKSLLENDGSENGKRLTSNEVDFTGRERKMEQALEDQAKLIDKYEAMENAQREWEEKFRENNCSTPDTGDPGSHSDITEERDEIKAQTSAHELKPDKQDGCFHLKMDSDLQTPCADCMQDQNCSSGHASVSSTQEFAFPTEVTITQRSCNQEIPEKGYYPSSHISQNSQHSHVSHDHPKNQSAHAFSSNSDLNGFKGEDSGSQNGHFALVPHGERGVGGVLEALKLAKQSLKQKIGGLQLIEGGSAERTVGLSIPTVKAGNRAEIPIGCAGLFRLPTDYSIEANRTEFVSPGTELSLGNYHPHTGVKVTDTGNPFPSSYMDMRSRFSADDRFLVSHNGESGSRFAAQMSHFDPYMDRGMLSPSIYTYPTLPLPTNFHYPDMMPRIPTSEGLSRTLSSRTVSIPPSDHLLYNDHIRPNMYNR
ncbi:hypothetical protein HS088_TW09G00651 [Tripterygium wilfordii]|uniref:Uncharacterized protein n=1 Tax=Tripterygium wilfordii TaxID=458696 RepID=A0A7J7D8A8_TRIWF|nr:uncharacterized protein LOC120006382 [Tripterygium wilfordii]KAF5742600.1 hypothetical protein HS088_TW09G00651 [Tripterygium wilfordii]